MGSYTSSGWQGLKGKYVCPVHIHPLTILSHADRRFNKYNKSLIKNPEVNLAFAATRDAAAHFVNLECEDDPVRRNHPHPGLPHACVLWGREEQYEPTDKELCDLRMQGVEVGVLSVSQFKVLTS